jgi:3-oxoacyl-[acyl-carrier-protein] synthase II
LLSGESGIRRITLFDVSDYEVTIGGDIPDFDGSTCIEHRELKRVDRFTQFGWVAADQAIRDSGLEIELIDRRRCGVILGSGIGGLITIEEQMAKLLHKGPDRVSPLTIPKLMLNAAGAHIAIVHGFRGPNFSVATACASATNAMGDALRSIRTGESDIVVSGGSEAALTRIGLAAFQNMKALSRRVDEPAKASRPFDRDRDGFVFSEGAGILVFEELEHARRRGARIYCEVLGYGTSCDAGHITSPDQEGNGAAKAMREAIEDAGINSEQVQYVNAHGTGTPLGDIAETRAVKSVFGPAAKNLAISSTKSQLGHTLGASGGIEAIVTALAIRDQVAPPTINLDTPDPECDLDYIPNQPRPMKIDVAMSNSFGFGGHNASILFGRFSG